MTKAYIMGFCKTAEAYGVDPVRLVKVANKVKATINGVNALAALTGEPILRGGKTIARPMLNLSKIRKALASGKLTPQVAANFKALMEGAKLEGTAFRDAKSTLGEIFKADGVPASKIRPALEEVPRWGLTGPRSMAGSLNFYGNGEWEAELAKNTARKSIPTKTQSALIKKLRKTVTSGKSLFDHLGITEAQRAELARPIAVTKRPVGPKVRRRR